MTAAKSQGLKLLGKKKKNLNGYSAWVKQGKKDGNETVCYIRRVSVERGSNVAQHVILQQISF